MDRTHHWKYNFLARMRGRKQQKMVEGPVIEERKLCARSSAMVLV